MARLRIALEAQECCWLLLHQIAKLCCLCHGFRQFELPRVYLGQSFAITLARCFSPLRRCPERFEPDILDARGFEPGREHVLGKARPARLRNGPHIGQQLHARLLQCRDHLVLCRALVSNRKYLHRTSRNTTARLTFRPLTGLVPDSSSLTAKSRHVAFHLLLAQQ